MICWKNHVSLVLTENEILVLSGEEEFELNTGGKTYSSEHFSFRYKG
jgi:hypothetical protein